ncbi:myelin protein zero-like protein 2 [Aplochiton taeniatus]
MDPTSGIIRGVGGIRVYTSGEISAVNGTDVRLKCTFHSSSTINPSTVTVSWSFRPLGPGPEESVFYFHDQPYPPSEGRFRKRAVWDGDIMGRDASIVLREVKFTYNGTYICQVKNRPDVHGNVGEVRLSVLTTASFSEIVILAAAIGGGIVIMVVLLIIIMSCRQCKKKRLMEAEDGVREAPPKERKDPTICHPLAASHLYESEEEIEIDSSDGMISYPSTRDPSSSEGEDDDDSDDDGGGGGSD